MMSMGTMVVIMPAKSSALQCQRPKIRKRILVRAQAKARGGSGKKKSSRKQPNQQTQRPEQPSVQLQSEGESKSEGESEIDDAAVKQSEEQMAIAVKSESSEIDVPSTKETISDNSTSAGSGEDLDSMRFGSRIPEIKEETPSFVEAVLDEARRISWPSPQKVAGQTGAVVGIVALGAATLLIVNSIFSTIAKQAFVSPTESKVQEIRRKKEEDIKKKEEQQLQEEKKFETFKIEKDKMEKTLTPSESFPDLLD